MQRTAEADAASDLTILWIAAIGSFVLAAASIPTLVRHRGRGPGVARAAKRSEMRYQEQDGPGLGRLRFNLLVPTGTLSWNASNVVTSERLGSPVHAFDIRVWSEHEVNEADGFGDGGTLFAPDTRRKRMVRRTRAKEASGCVVTLPINAPWVSIVKENLASKLLVSATRVDLDVESDFFNRTYHVLTSNKAFAQHLLDAQMLDLIVQGEGRMEFEFLGSKLLIRTPLLEPELMPGLVAYGERFPKAVSRLVREHYRDASALDI
ncbi:MAG: hypothetical protein AAGA37_15490 [Actinomycetota bacterium]